MWGFFLRHCQYLLVNIDSSESLSQKLTKSAILVSDTALAAYGSQCHAIRPALTEILKRQRLRPKWHEIYLDLEDACWDLFLGDIPAQIDDGAHYERKIPTSSDVVAVSYLLRDSMDTDLNQKTPQKNAIKSLIRHAFQGNMHIGRADSGPHEENDDDYFCYGILDLLSQLTFRLRKRMRPTMFVECLKMVRAILGRKPQSTRQCLKATNLWNQVLECSNRDRCLYGNEDDRRAIAQWLMQHHTKGVEKADFSVL